MVLVTHWDLRLKNESRKWFAIHWIKQKSPISSIKSGEDQFSKSFLVELCDCVTVSTWLEITTWYMLLCVFAPEFAEACSSMSMLEAGAFFSSSLILN